MNDSTWILLAMFGYAVVVMWHNYQMAKVAIEATEDAKTKIIKAIKEMDTQ